MKTMINGKILIFLLIPFLIFGEKPFVLFTVPKSGTHLSGKLLEHLTGKTGSFLYRPGYDFKKVYPIHFAEGTFYFLHYRHWKGFDQQSSLYQGMELFVNVRDPRDVCVSSAFFFRKELDCLLGRDASFDDRLAYVIQTEMIHDGVHDFFGPLAFYNNIFELMDRYDPMIIHFEDLVGPQGGGDLEKQRLIIQQVASRIDLYLTEEEARAIGEKIFGNSLTFREGHIGSWKKYFKKCHINSFKESGLENALISLGYEQNHGW